MKIEIVKFDNGLYGVRKTVWFNILLPLSQVHQYLYLRRKDEYNPEVRDFVHWMTIDHNNIELWQDDSLDFVRKEYTRYMDMLQARRRLARAKKAVNDDKGKVVVV
jgi:hypothetical protein